MSKRKKGLEVIVTEKDIVRKVLKYFREMTSQQRRDIVALIVLIIGLVLISFGVDHTVSAVTVAVAGYYFGRREANKKE